MVKISDVAREAGVSIATVSRAMNGNPTVDPSYAERVLAAAERLGYRPNGVARSLRRRSTDVLALIIGDVSNSFFTAITRGVEDVAQRNGFSVLLCNSDEEPDKEATYLRVVEQEQVAGVLISPHSSVTDISRLGSARIPTVVIDRPVLDEFVDSVLVESTKGARIATEHLIDQGWRRPACITGPENATTAEQRLEGYRQALQAHGFDREIVAHSTFRQSGGSAAAAELLDTDDAPDAFFVANSQMALGVIDEIKKRGLRIGRDVGVIAFDDTPWAPFIDPPLSVIAQPAYEVGARAAELLTERIRGGSSASPRHEVFSTTLIVRDSSRRLS